MHAIGYFFPWEHHLLLGVAGAIDGGIERILHSTEGEFHIPPSVPSSDDARSFGGLWGLWGGVAVGEVLEEGRESWDAGRGDPNVHLDCAPEDQHRRVAVLSDNGDLDHSHHRADGCKTEHREKDYQHDLFGLG